MRPDTQMLLSLLDLIRYHPVLRMLITYDPTFVRSDLGFNWSSNLFHNGGFGLNPTGTRTTLAFVSLAPQEESRP